MSNTISSLRGTAIGRSRSMPGTRPYVYRGKHPWKPEQIDPYATPGRVNYTKLRPTEANVANPCGTDAGWHEHIARGNMPCDACWDPHARMCGRVKAGKVSKDRKKPLTDLLQKPVNHGTRFVANDLGCKCTVCYPLMQEITRAARERQRAKRDREKETAS